MKQTGADNASLAFVDTNVLVYVYSSDEAEKQTIAQSLMRGGLCVLSTQVLQEFANTASRKLKIDWPSISKALKEISDSVPVWLNTEETIQQACLLADRYRYSFYDSLIISAALECGCGILYSEDLQHGQLIEGKLRILNPFLENRQL